MLRKIRKESRTLSSNWYKKYKVPYLILVFDIIVLIIISLFALKEFLIGSFDKSFGLDSILILLLTLILMICRFNLSLLVFKKQRLGMYVSTIFLFIVILFEIYYLDTTSPFLFVLDSIIRFINKYIIVLPYSINKILQYFLYLYSFYFPILFYAYLILFKKKINNNAKKFDVLTGFYASTLSKKLKIMDLIIISFQLAIGMSIGLISDYLYLAFLAVPLSLYSVNDLIRRLNLKKTLSKLNLFIIIQVTILLIFGIIYTQRIPYWGLITFISSIIIIYLLLSFLTKNFLKSIIITIISFIIIPILCLGYNIFSYPQYGVIGKNIPFDGEKVFFIVKDKNGYLGIRNRSNKLIKPTYRVVDYNKKNYVMLLNKNNEWEIYNLENKVFITNQSQEQIKNHEYNSKCNN